MNSESIRLMLEGIKAKYLEIEELIESYDMSDDVIVSNMVAVMRPSDTDGGMDAELVYSIACQSPEQLGFVIEESLASFMDELYEDDRKNDGLDDLLDGTGISLN